MVSLAVWQAGQVWGACVTNSIEMFFQGEVAGSELACQHSIFMVVTIRSQC